MLLLGFVVTGFIHIQSTFTRDVAADLEEQAIGGIQVEGAVTIERGLVLGAKLGK